MPDCDYCNVDDNKLPFNCKRCGGTFCGSHRLPEKHECPGVPTDPTFGEYLGGTKTRESEDSKKIGSTTQRGDFSLIEVVLIPVILLYWVLPGTLRYLWRYRITVLLLGLVATLYVSWV